MTPVPGRAGPPGPTTHRSAARGSGVHRSGLHGSVARCSAARSSASRRARRPRGGLAVGGVEEAGGRAPAPAPVARRAAAGSSRPIRRERPSRRDARRRGPWRPTRSPRSRRPGRRRHRPRKSGDRSTPGSVERGARRGAGDTRRPRGSSSRRLVGVRAVEVRALVQGRRSRSTRRVRGVAGPVDPDRSRHGPAACRSSSDGRGSTRGGRTRWLRAPSIPCPLPTDARAVARCRCRSGGRRSGRRRAAAAGPRPGPRRRRAARAGAWRRRALGRRAVALRLGDQVRDAPLRRPLRRPGRRPLRPAAEQAPRGGPRDPGLGTGLRARHVASGVGSRSVPGVRARRRRPARCGSRDGRRPRGRVRRGRCGGCRAARCRRRRPQPWPSRSPSRGQGGDGGRGVDHRSGAIGARAGAGVRSAGIRGTGTRSGTPSPGRGSSIGNRQRQHRPHRVRGAAAHDHGSPQHRAQGGVELGRGTGRAGGDAVQHPARPVDADEQRRGVARPGVQLTTPLTGERPDGRAALAQRLVDLGGQVRPQPLRAGRRQRTHREPAGGQHDVHGLQPPVLGLDRHLAAAGHRHPHGTEVDLASARPAASPMSSSSKGPCVGGPSPTSSPTSPRPGPRAAHRFSASAPMVRAPGSSPGSTGPCDRSVRPPRPDRPASPSSASDEPRPRRAITNTHREAARARRWSRSHPRRARTPAGPGPRRTGRARRVAPPAARSGRRAGAPARPAGRG